MKEDRVRPLAPTGPDDALRAALASAGAVIWTRDLASGRRPGAGWPAVVPEIAPSIEAGLAGSIHPDDRGGVDAALAAACAGERAYEAEFRLASPGGALRWVRERGAVERDAAGRPLRLVGVTLDVTAAKRAEIELVALRDRLGGELAKMSHLRQLGLRLAAANDAAEVFDAIVETGVAVTGAEGGALQLLERAENRLVIVASTGLDRSLLDLFGSVRPQDAPVSGRAIANQDRVIVEDVESSPVYAGSRAREALLAAGIRSIYSAPLPSRSGRPWGVLSTFRRSPTPRSRWELDLLDLLCDQIAGFIERTEAERTRRDSDEMFRVLANTVPDMTWMAAPDGTLIFVSDRWTQYCGIDPMQHAEKWPEPVLHPEDRARRIAFWQAALRDGTGYEIEVRKRRHDGTYRWFLTRAEPIRGPDGEVRGWFGSTTDIDDRKRVEQALREREAQLAMAVEAGRIGVWRVEPEKGCAMVSERLAAMLGLPPGKLLLSVEEWQRAVHPDDRQRVLAELKAAVAARRGFNLEFRIVRPKGETRWLMAAGDVEESLDGSSRARHVAGVVFDITERKLTEERQSLLMAELDHRVRNILATIQAMVAVSGRNATSVPEYAAGLRGRIAAMAGAHSLLTRAQWQGADLADIVQNEMQAYAEAVVVRGPPGCVLGAKQALDFALSLHELATNAAKYGALSVPGGRVFIEWRVEPGGPGEDGRASSGPGLRFMWRESGGPPIPRPPAAKGFGSRLIERALPRMALAYDPAGVRCEAWLPLRDRAAPDVGPSREAERWTACDGQPVLAGHRVLVVEDEPLVALELKSVLDAAGAETVTAGSLGAAGAQAEKPLSAAVLDINLGDGMSYPVARRLLDRKLPVVFATGYEAGAVVPEDLKDVPVLQKPIDSTRLVRLLAALLRPTQ